MSLTISPTFTFVKNGMFYFSRRIPKELSEHYTATRIAYSLRTKSARIAEARARRAADQLDEDWYHLQTQLGHGRGLDAQPIPSSRLATSFVRCLTSINLWLMVGQMKITAKVSRGPQTGEIVTPHRHEDGTYVVSPTRFKVDYIHVATLEEFASKLQEGFKGRMSSPSVKGPRLFSPNSITIVT